MPRRANEYLLAVFTVALFLAGCSGGTDTDPGTVTFLIESMPLNLDPRIRFVERDDGDTADAMRLRERALDSDVEPLSGSHEHHGWLCVRWGLALDDSWLETGRAVQGERLVVDSRSGATVVQQQRVGRQFR